MKIGDRVFVRGYIDEIRKDTVIVRNDGGYFGTVLSEVTGELPSAQPELIRCKDCKHMIEHKSYGDMGESAYTCEGNMDGWVLPDSYCSYAERRADDSISD